MTKTGHRTVDLRQGYITFLARGVDVFMLGPEERKLFAGLTDLMDAFELERDKDKDGTAEKERLKEFNKG